VTNGSTRKGRIMSLKRLLMVMMAAALLALGAAACGGSDDDDGDGGGNGNAGAAADSTSGGGGSNDGPVTIVASVPPTDHGWLGAISKNAQEAADQFDDVDFRLLEAADADSQAQQIEQVISEKPDALVVLPQDG
jgi:ribose transport system substrate-binding protein